MTAAPIALVNARLIDPAADAETRGGVYVADGVLRDVGAHVTPGQFGADVEIVDCGGDVVCPGLVDMRVFVGEPGAEYRETLATASAAAAAGGVSTIVAMPDTNPPIDDPAVLDFFARRARDTAKVRVLASAALTRGLKGSEIVEFGLLREAGAVAFTDGFRSVRDSRVMLRAMRYARDFDALIMPFCEDHDLAAGGVMNEGELSSRLGLAGIPAEAEAIALERDMRLVAMTGARYHAALVSTAMSLDIVAKAKAAGLPVTCGVSINNLALNENDIGHYRTFFKLAPPLRGEDDRRALVAGLASGLIDVVVSDHNPQDVDSKLLPFGEAENGAVGLETLLPAALRLVHSGDVALPRLLRAMSLRPAEILRLPQGRLEKGAPADLARFDPDTPFVVEASKLRSRSKNTPFEDARLQGRVKTTMVAGVVVHA